MKCTDCRSSQICVNYKEASFTVERRCLEVPSACSSSRSCGCLASYACVDSYRQCTQDPDGLGCNCPAC